jgi:hypothetical protein
MPGLHPPIVNISGHPDLGAGDILLTANHNSQPGPMILNSRGQLVWFQPIRHRGAFNLQLQHYRGQPVLTWWEGRDYFHGRDVVVSPSYRTVAVVRGAEGYQPDLHEFQITRQGTALLDAYSETRADLSGIGGPRNGTVVDCIILEQDIRTGQVLWEWHSLAHVPPSASQYPVASSGAYDYFHLNSIQQLPGGNLLISAKGTWAVYEISRQTGRIVWTLGGKNSSFSMGRGTRFEWQHDAHLAGHTLSLFDDAATPQEEPQSSGKLLHLDTRNMTASLVQRYTHRPSALADSSGSVQTLPDGNVFVGWGSAPYFSEYTPGGRQVWGGSEALGLYSYRAFRASWTGQPGTRPALAVRRSGGTVRLFSSWNGATRIAAWRVLAGRGPHTLRPLGPAVPWRGFETVTVRRTALADFAVEALAGDGHILGRSTLEVPRS